MGAVFFSGILYLFFTVTGLRAMLFRAVPKTLRAAISVGIGFFITIIGLTIGEITRVTIAGFGLANIIPEGGCFYSSGSSSYICPNGVDIPFAYRSLGVVNFVLHPAARIAVIGLMFVSLFEMLQVKGAIIMAICAATFIGINYCEWFICQ